MSKKDAEKEKEAEEIKLPEKEIAPGDVPPEGISAEDWMDLSPTEREAVLSKDDDEEEAGKGEAPELDEETLKELSGVEKKGEEGEPSQVKEKEAEAKEEIGTEAQQKILIVTDEALLSFRPVIDESKLTIADEVPETIQAQFDELETQFDEGEIDRKVYNQKRDALNRKILMDSMGARESMKSSLVWDEEQRFFLRSRPEYLGEVGEDGQFRNTLESSMLYGALGKVLDALNADPAHSRLSGMELLLKADGVVKKMFRKSEGAAAEKETEKETKKADPLTLKPKAPLPEHKTLSGIPTAGTNTVDDAYTQLDKLTGEAYEKALEKLTPDQKEAYERRV